MKNNPTFSRVLIKFSGEALLGHRQYGTDPEILDFIAGEIKEVAGLGVEIGIIVGGGNIFRGSVAEKAGMDRVMGDYAGMLAGVINGLMLESELNRKGVAVRLMSSIQMPQIAEAYIYKRALRHFAKKRVIIFAGGTGNPYFTHDSAASLKAAELKCDLLIKAARVDGIYNKDPEKHTDAVKFDTVTYQEALEKRLQVMDSTAFAMCMDAAIPIVVYNLYNKGDFKRIVMGEKIGTRVGF